MTLRAGVLRVLERAAAAEGTAAGLNAGLDPPHDVVGLLPGLLLGGRVVAAIPRNSTGMSFSSSCH
jgi:hypothetical protein